MPKPRNRKNSTGIMTLLAFSMPPATPIAMIAMETTRPMSCHTPLPIPNRPLENIAPTDCTNENASPFAFVSVAEVASNAGPMMLMSCPIANRPPEIASQVYLKIQPSTTV